MGGLGGFRFWIPGFRHLLKAFWVVFIAPVQGISNAPRRMFRLLESFGYEVVSGARLYGANVGNSHVGFDIKINRLF